MQDRIYSTRFVKGCKPCIYNLRRITSHFYKVKELTKQHYYHSLLTRVKPSSILSIQNSLKTKIKRTSNIHSWVIKQNTVSFLLTSNLSNTVIKEDYRKEKQFFKLSLELRVKTLPLPNNHKNNRTLFYLITHSSNKIIHVGL